MSAARTIGLYWHTLRHLRPVQIYGRLWFRLYRPRPDLAPAPGLRSPSGAWQTPAARAPSLSGPGEFRFLGEAGRLAEIGWDGPQRDKLWRYNQHYFDDLHAAGEPDRTEWHTALIADWIAQNPPGRGTGWEPYPTSLRIVNWIKRAQAGHALSPEAAQSLAVQARWLSRRLEYHLLGNHLFSNAKALVFAGLFFEGVEAGQWLATGLDILVREVPEQILADGGHFELSPMYHALALEDLLDLVNLAHRYRMALTPAMEAAVDGWCARVQEMRRWLHAMSHPDGAISFFNDAAFDIAPANAALDAYAGRLGFEVVNVSPPTQWLAQSGYARLSRGAAIALLDMAPVGPDYLPGHAHADTLSFELSLFGERVLVNSGTSCYGESAERLRQRGTAAHNTVKIAGRNSSEVWGGFRVARRARLRDAVLSAGDPLIAHGAHDGYRRLPGRPLHQRRWRMDKGSLAISDRIGTAVLPAEALFHFHPGVTLMPGSTSSAGEGVTPKGRKFSWRVGRGGARLEPSTWHPRFGESRASQCLVIDLHEGQSEIVFAWHEERP
ncbi:MAG: alginate lyase family protein [Parvibaculum sp.]|uniref:heparinase II/III family protein n=1 Tax=Parvibaculum sp. TaxID=2024848 RepID=UPI0032EF6F7B